MSRIDDRVLIERIQKGDRQAFDELIGIHSARAYQYAYRLTRDQEVASDVVSDAFVRMYGALKSFRFQSAFTTWMYRILTNCYLDHRKREKNRQHASLEQTVRTDSGEVERQIEDEGPTPDELAEHNARESTVARALGRLPEYQSAMLVMFHVEALSYEDIADALDLPLGTVKSRLNRARQALREELAQDEELFRL